MLSLIRWHDGKTREAVVLVHMRSLMRLAVAGVKDTVELRRRGAEWYGENNKPVQFVFLMARDAVASETPNVARAAAVRYAC